MTNIHSLQAETRRHTALRDELLRRWPDLANDDETLAGTLEGLSSLTDQIAAVATSIDDDGIMLAGIDERSKVLAERHRRISERIDNKKAAILHAMQESGERKIELPTVTLSVRQNPQSVLITDETIIPDAFKNTPEPPAPKPNKIIILQALKDGKEVPGCVINNGSISLAMRLK